MTLLSGTVWAEIGKILRDFMNSNYIKKNSIDIGVSRLVKRDVAALHDLSEYRGKKMYLFYQTGRSYHPYTIITVVEEDGSNIIVEDLSFEYPYNEKLRMEVEKVIRDFVRQATGGKVYLDRESINAMIRKAGKDDQMSKTIKDFKIRMRHYKYRKRQTYGGGLGWALAVRVSK
jgi:hypothetical protein